MAQRKYRYWIYAHDEDGELLDTFDSEVETLDEAIIEAADFLMRLETTTLSADKCCVRIVDQNDTRGNGGHETVWFAGPVKALNE